MKYSISTKSDDITDMVFIQKLIDYCSFKGISLSIEQTGERVNVAFDAPDEETELLDFIKKQHEAMA